MHPFSRNQDCMPLVGFAEETIRLINYSVIEKPDGRGLWPRSYALIMYACLSASHLSEPGFIGL